MATVTLSLLVLKTRRIDALRRFYGTFGVELIQEQHGSGPVYYAGRMGGTVFEVYPLPDDGMPADATTRLGFTVDDVAEVVRALQAGGTPVVAEPRESPWGLRAVVRDPDGRAVEFYQR